MQYPTLFPEYDLQSAAETPAQVEVIEWTLSEREQQIIEELNRTNI